MAPRASSAYTAARRSTPPATLAAACSGAITADPAPGALIPRLCVELEHGHFRGPRRLSRQQVAKLRRRQVPREAAMARDRDGGRLLGHDDDERVGLLGEAERGAMTRAERAVLEGRLRERQD